MTSNENRTSRNFACRIALFVLVIVFCLPTCRGQNDQLASGTASKLEQGEEHAQFPRRAERKASEEPPGMSGTNVAENVAVVAQQVEDGDLAGAVTTYRNQYDPRRQHVALSHCANWPFKRYGLAVMPIRTSAM